ncbi:MAG: hypothetical protein EZS28_026457 [Streblomastix strix]|uniref:Pyridoxamine 5'-phosphate oxidase putative domain-containing protein n=1 Tax=Streblomastix strix TaxID=222440 RepID=A0A5J4V5Z2_9EUKA|nr:MAG: hypothetical protein EZS28_026457 [Streblomastix strix]
MANAAEKFLLTHKDHFLWSVLITSDKLRPVPRVANLCHSEDIGFYYSAKSTTSKIAQIEKNPLATISIYPQKGFANIIAEVTLKISAERKTLDAICIMLILFYQCFELLFRQSLDIL